MASRSASASRRGLFVTLDGPSGVGKTTVGALLGNRLAGLGVPTLVTATPSSSKIGELARHGTHEFHGAALTCLVAADRYHHWESTVLPSIDQGTTVVCDRYVPSSLVLDPLDGVGRDFVWNIYRGIGVPDIAFILVGDALLCAGRASMRGHYSRFHAADYENNRHELAMFTEALRFLRNVGYPARKYDIGSATAEEVAEALVNVVLGVKDGRL